MPCPTYTLYLQLENTGDTYIPLSSLGINLEDYMCGLFSLHGHLDLLPYDENHLQRCFLCCDMLTDQALLPGYITLPVLREIPLPTYWDQPQGKDYHRLTLHQDFSQIIYLDTKNTLFRDVRLYLTNEKGELFALHKAQLHCTLLVFPKYKTTRI
jgi:hypothetical protein